MKSHVGTFVLGLMTVIACAARAQEPPPVPPPPVQPPPVVTTPLPAVPAQTPIPSAQTPPAGEPSQVAPAIAAPPAPTRLTPDQVRERRSAIFLMEGVLVNAVRQAAGNTAAQIQAVQPAPMVFTSAPARAHGSYLESYGVFFYVEIPSVMPSVASVFETLQRERSRQSSPAQPTSVAGTTAIINPDAHYVESVKRRLVNAMLDYSKALDLGADEWLTVEAREAQEIPGTISQPSTLQLRVRGSDLIEFLTNRLSREEVLKRVQVRGF